MPRSGRTGGVFIQCDSHSQCACARAFQKSGKEPSPHRPAGSTSPRLSSSSPQMLRMNAYDSTCSVALHKTKHHVSGEAWQVLPHEGEHARECETEVSVSLREAGSVAGGLRCLGGGCGVQRLSLQRSSASGGERLQPQRGRGIVSRRERLQPRHCGRSIRRRRQRRSGRTRSELSKRLGLLNPKVAGQRNH